MLNRSNISQREGSARSRLSQILHDQDILAGSTVLMKHACGKQGCKCSRGELHHSLYLAFNYKGKRKMVSIRPELTDEVKAAVENYKRFKPLLQALSEECFERLVSQRKE